MKKTLFLLSLGLLGILPLTVKAQDIAPQPCDTGFWNQMKSKAWMEAEREIMQNQNLIFKPDSVLEYTCFDQFAAINAWQGGDIFVHSNYFGSEIITRGSTYAMEKAMENVVYNALLAYRNLSFNNQYLSGRAQDMGLSNRNSVSAADGDYFKKPEQSNASYTCTTMQDVWKAAKCANFIDNAAVAGTDGFYPFATLAGFNGSPEVGGYEDKTEDVRKWPESLACGTSTGVHSWTDQIVSAENKNQDHYQFQTPLGQIYVDVGDRLEPGNCSGPGNEAIKTGVQVITREGEHPDGVCTNPGCSYQEDGTCS